MNFLTLLVLGQAIVPNRAVAPGSTATQSTATQTLYVSTTGNDNNPCTSAGAACLTIDGALNKLPNTLRHDATISVAAGAYAAPLNITRKDLTIVGGVTLSVTGTMSTPTLTTGTTSGTLTASAAGSASIGPGTVTDSGQSWTVNELKNKFIRFSSGTLSGQSFPISSNTATVITIPSNQAAGTVAYTIEEIGSTFVSSSAITWRGLQGAGNLSLSNLKVERSSSGSGPSPNIGAVLTLTNVWVKGATGNGMFAQSGIVVATRAIFEGTTGSAFGMSAVQGSATGVIPSKASVSSCIARATTGTAFSVPVFPAVGTFAPVIAEVSTGIGISNAGTQSGQSASAWVTCSSTGTGIQIGATISNSSPFVYASQAMNGGVRITGCATGISVVGFASSLANAPAFDTVTTAFSATRGGTIDLNGTTPAFTSVTNEFGIDGTFYSLANLDALAAPKIYTNNYGSRIIR